MHAFSCNLLILHCCCCCCVFFSLGFVIISMAAIRLIAADTWKLWWVVEKSHQIECKCKIYCIFIQIWNDVIRTYEFDEWKKFDTAERGWQQLYFTHHYYYIFKDFFHFLFFFFKSCSQKRFIISNKKSQSAIYFFFLN